MSKGLEALKYISKQLGTNLVNNNYLQTIEKELKALEIIKELGIFNFKGDNYITTTMIGERLTQEKYDLLREVLCD